MTAPTRRNTARTLQVSWSGDRLLLVPRHPHRLLLPGTLRHHHDRSAGADGLSWPWRGPRFVGWGVWILIARAGVRRGWWLVAQDDGEPVSAYLRILGLTEASTREDVKRAYRKRAKRYHPDAGGNVVQFRELVEARERVLDELASA